MTPSTSATCLEPVRDAGELAQRRAHGVGVDAALEAHAAAAIALSMLCGRAAHLGRVDHRLAAPARCLSVEAHPQPCPAPNRLAPAGRSSERLDSAPPRRTAPGWRRCAASRRDSRRACACRSRWSCEKLRNTAASGANAIVSSSWKLDASHTTVAAGSSEPASELTGVPTLPATATGDPAARCIAPISSTVVVFPFVPVTAMNSFGTSRHPSSSSPMTSMSLARARARRRARPAGRRGS